jgi:MFS family permease
MTGLEVVRSPGVLLLLGVAFASQLAFFAFQSVYVLWSERLVFHAFPEAVGQQAIGGLLTFVGLCAIATQLWLVGPLVRRFGERMLVFGGNLVRALAFWTLAASPTILASVVTVPFVALGGGVALPALIAVLTYAAPPDGRGQVIGLQQSAAAMGSVVGPLLAGYLYENVQPNAAMVGAAVAMSAAVLVALNVFRLPRPAHGPRPAPEPAQPA